MKLFRAVVILLGLLGLWQLVVWLTGAPHYILPAPGRVGLVLAAQVPLLAHHAATTFAEILLGLLCGTALGTGSALAISWFRPLRAWLLPIMVMGYSIPVFALAPILVLWLGYGMASKVAMTTLIIYFPVASAFFDGLRRTEPGWLDLADAMGGTPLKVLMYIRVPAALPALSSGLRVATAIAPIGAVVGEWVGSSSGLGYLMLQANGRMQIDLMFAALVVLTTFSITLYLSVDAALRRAIPWQADDLTQSNKD